MLFIYFIIILIIIIIIIWIIYYSNYLQIEIISSILYYSVPTSK